MGIVARHDQTAVDPDTAIAAGWIIGNHHMEPFAPERLSEVCGTVVVAQVACGKHLYINGLESAADRVYLLDSAAFGACVDEYISFPNVFIDGPVGVPAHFRSGSGVGCWGEACIPLEDEQVIDRARADGKSGRLRQVP